MEATNMTFTDYSGDYAIVWGDEDFKGVGIELNEAETILLNREQVEKFSVFLNDWLENNKQEKKR